MWCLKENEMAILRTEKAMMRAMCGVKIIEKRKSQELIYFGWTSHGEWSAMVWTCLEKE